MKKTRIQESADILPRLERMMDSMTRSEIRIAKRLLASPNEFVRSSVRGVAADLGVSEPTILRFCRAIGCEGFKDLKFRLIQELALTQAMSDQAVRAASRAARASLRPGTRIPMAIACSTRSSKRSRARATRLQYKDLLTSAQAIAKAGRVLVYGIGGSSATLAAEAHNRLFRLNIPDHGVHRRLHPTHVGGDPGAKAMSRCSFPRPADRANCRKAWSWRSTTRPPASPSPTKTRRWGVTPTSACMSGWRRSGAEEIQPSPMRFAQLFVIDRLAYAVAAVVGERAHVALRRMRGSVAWLHGIAPQQPIGD